MIKTQSHLLSRLLRDYQELALSKIEAALSKDKARALVVMPTGTGKTKIMIETTRRKFDQKILIIYNRITLVEQLAKQMDAAIYCAGMGFKNLDNRITIASSQSLIKTKDFQSYDLVIVDEAHLNFEKLIKKILEVNQEAKFLGFTATPYDSKGYIYGEKKFYMEPCYKENMLYFIERGFLVPAICKEPDNVFDTSKLRIRNGEYVTDNIATDDEFILSQIKDALGRIGTRKKAIWFCCNIAHAEKVNNFLRDKLNEKSVTIHSELDNYDDLKLFETQNDIRHLTFVSVVSTGYDYPPIDACIIMRPTKSPSLYVQTVGRGLRPSDGKENLLVLDYGNVIKELGPITDPVIDSKLGKMTETQKHKTCPECRTHNPLAKKICVDCGYSFEKAEFEAHTKLNLKADEQANVLANKPRKFITSSITINESISKSGNEMYTIDYFSLNDNVREFFVKENEWAMNKLYKVLEKAEIKLEKKVHQVSLEVTYIMDGKYKKILNVKRRENGNNNT